MSRSGYCDDYEHMELYRASVDRAIAGKRGQKFLREMVDALEAMPVKALAAEVLRKGGEVCALGAVGARRGLNLEALDPEDPDAVGKAFNIAQSLAREVTFENDDDFGYKRHATPEERWTHMHAWAKGLLKSEVAGGLTDAGK